MHGRRKPKSFHAAQRHSLNNPCWRSSSAHRNRGAWPRRAQGGLIKHALVQDIAYASLLKSRRNELHGRIAAVLEARFAHQCDADID